MQSHSDIVRRAGSAESVAQARGVSVHTVRSWIARNSIPAEHWLAFSAEGITTLDELAAAAATKRASAPAVAA